MAYIKFENITKSYDGKNLVLKNIDQEVEEGKLVTLLGPSGCGKSTLLRCLSGLEMVTSGKIYLDGRDVTYLEPRERNIGMVFQQYSLFPNMTVAQNVAFGMKMKKMPQDKIEKKTKEMLDIVGLGDKLDRYPAQLSGGQQQRAALARAIVTEPKVLLLDEPLSAIDALLRRNLQIEIRRIQKELGITAIFVTHDQEEAMVMSDVIHLMHDGIIEQSAAPTEMYIKPTTKFAASFIGHYNLLPAAVLSELTGEKLDCDDVAFRPELVHITESKPSEPDCLFMEGVIENTMPHGNILRYAVNCSGTQIDVDELFTDIREIPDGTHCWLSIKKSDAIML